MRDHTRQTREGQDPPARHLRIVPKDPPPKPKRKQRHRMGATFTPEEEGRIRAGLRRARALFGTWACTSDALRVAEGTAEDVAAGRQRVTGDIVIRLARALGVPVDSLYRAPTEAGTCPTCGARRTP